MVTCIGHEKNLENKEHNAPPGRGDHAPPSPVVDERAQPWTRRERRAFSGKYAFVNPRGRPLAVATRVVVIRIMIRQAQRS